MEEELSSSLFLPGGGFFDNHVTVSGCLWGIWHQSWKWSRVCLDRLELFIDEVYENSKFCSCQTLQVLITHFQLEPCSTSSSCRMCHKKQNPPHVPKLHPVEDVWESYNSWFARDAKKPKLSTSLSSERRSAFATLTEAPSKHVWTDSRPTLVYEVADGSPWDLLGFFFF